MSALPALASMRVITPSLNHGRYLAECLESVAVTVADFRMHGHNLSQRNRGRTRDMEKILTAERQFVESRAVRRAYGITLFHDPYLNGLVDGILWIAAKGWKAVKKSLKV